MWPRSKSGLLYFLMFQKTADKASAGLYSLQFQNIGTQSVQELFFCDRSIRRTVYSNDFVYVFWLRCTARKKLYIRCYIGNGKIA